MKKILAVLVLIMFGLFKVVLAQDTAAAPTKPVASLTVGTKAWGEAVKKAQDLNKEGKYQEAVDAAPLDVQKAWYSLNLLRQMMGGTKSAKGWWNHFSFDAKTLQFTGDKDKCLVQVAVVKGYAESISEGVYSKDQERIKFYVQEYEDWISKGLPKEDSKDSEDN